MAAPAVGSRDGRSKSKRRLCPRPGCGRTWIAVSPDEGEVCPTCRLGQKPLSTLVSSTPPAPQKVAR